MLSYIEVWDVNEDLTGTSNSGILMDDSDDHQFFTYDYGEIIRINHEQCELEPSTDPDIVSKHSSLSQRISWRHAGPPIIDMSPDELDWRFPDELYEL